MTHHIWCSFFGEPEEGCWMCKKLRKDYPEDCSPKEMVKKHFPNVKVIPKNKEV